MKRAALPKIKPAPKHKKVVIKPAPKKKAVIKPAPVQQPATQATELGPRTADDLRKLAESQTDAELTSQINPLETQAATTQSREAAASAELDRMFGDISPAVSDALHVVSANFDKTQAAEQALFAQAGQRLNQMKQDAASQAQDLAQRIGGPVAVDKFTGAIDPSLAAFGPESAGSLLHSSATGQAGVQEMGDWAGKVFPLIRTEKQLSTRQKYEDQITKIQDDIATLKGTKQGKIDSRLNDLLTSERSYQLQLAQSKLEKVKAARDWLATQHTLRNDDRRLALAQGQFGVSVANTRLRQKEIAARVRHMTTQDKLTARKLNMSDAQFAQKMANAEENTQIARQRVAVMKEKNAIQMAKALQNPTSAKPITLTRRIYYPKGSYGEATAKAAVAQGKSGYYGDPKRHQFFHVIKETMMPGQWTQRNTGGNVPITKPQQMYQTLRGLGVDPKVARNAVKKATGVDPIKKRK
jgi:hypothetical protein